MASEHFELKQELNKLLQRQKFARIKNIMKNININFSKSIDYAQEKYVKLKIANYYRNRNKLELFAYQLH